MNPFKYFKGSGQNPITPPPPKVDLRRNLDENLADMRRVLGDTNDLMIRELELKGVGGIQAALIGIDGLIDSFTAQTLIAHVMAVDLSIITEDQMEKDYQKAFDLLFKSRISMMDASQSDDFNVLYANLLNGHVIVLMDQVVSGMIFDCKGWQMRSISEPNVEKSLRGPKDSFVETIRINTATLRRRIRDPRLRFDAYQVGRITKTDVFVAYIEGLTNPRYIQLAKERLENFDVDGIVGVTQLLRVLEDAHHTIFPRLIETERPDRAASALMEGQIAVLVDGNPFVILGPFFFTGSFSSVDDYYNEPLFATLKRIMRYAAFFFVILGPGLYIAVATFHQEMIPLSLLIIFINQRSALPFSTFVEMCLVFVIFEIIREASLRKPTAVGDAMTMVGSLIIGQAIVEVGLVSYVAIIIGAVTTLASYLLSTTRINTSTRILTFLFMFTGSWLGFYGITLGFIMLVLHLCSLTSFEEPYMAPLAPFNLRDQKDQVARMPFSWMKYRPKIFKTKNVVRSELPIGKE